MAFKDETLTFEDTRILNEGGAEVMMGWEAPIMEKSAEFICHNKGDILEIGFGMGICANYIQAQGVNSHTIVEIHPQIFEKLQEWASDKSNVTIIQGDWNNVSGLSAYDGIFIDTYGDDNWPNFKDFALGKAKSGAKITYWNNFNSENNEHLFDSISFENISISPNSNSYMNGNTYYMPKVEL
jgi:protein arginine N-methyltransferase 2